MVPVDEHSNVVDSIIFFRINHFKRDIQSKEKKTTHAISNQKTSVYIDHEPENIQGYIFAQLEELKKYFDKI
jgi:hypothetical protein